MSAFDKYFLLLSMVGTAPDAESAHPGMPRKVSWFKGAQIVMLIKLHSVCLMIPSLHYGDVAFSDFCCPGITTQLRISSLWSWNEAKIVPDWKKKKKKRKKGLLFLDLLTISNRLMFLDWPFLKCWFWLSFMYLFFISCYQSWAVDVFSLLLILLLLLSA